MSFFGQRPDTAQFRIINDNTLSVDVRDVTGGDAPIFPTVNIGPWGRDCHKKLERVYAPYAFDVLPDVVAEVAEALLRA
jgi:arginine utilization protein RocB